MRAPLKIAKEIVSYDDALASVWRLARSVTFLPLVLALSLSYHGLLGRQHSISISGTVFKKDTKEPIPFANVIVIGSTFGASTDTLGKFRIDNIPPGSYELRFSVLGYAPLIIRNVAVNTAQMTHLDIPMTEQYVQMSDVVTVGGQQVNVPELNVSTRYLDYREIQHTAGAFDDVLRTITILPGVAQTRIDRNDLSVRGGSPAENLSLIDGFEVDNINHFGTQGSGGGSTTFLNLDFVDNSFFSGGGFGVPYGDKLSSVLSIDMRQGRGDMLRAKTTLSATQVGLNVDGPITESSSFLFSGRRSYLDPFFKLYGYSFAPYFWDFLAKATYRVSAWDQVEVLGIGIIDRVRRFDENQKQIDENDSKILGQQTRAMGGVTWKHGFSSGLLSVRGSSSFSDYRYEQIGDTVNPAVLYNPYMYNGSYELETSLKADMVVQVFASTELDAGVGAKTARLHSRLQTTVIPTGYTQDTRVIPINLLADSSGHKFSGYLQLSQTIWNMVLTGGVRADYFSMIHEPFVVAPRFSMSMNLFPTTRLNASAGRYYQAPSYIWLMANPYNKGLTHLGMDQYVLGLEHSIQRDLIITIEGYLKQYDHYPVSLTRPYIVMVNSGAEVEQIAEAYAAFGLDFLQSSGTGFSRGIELFVQKKVSDSPLYGRMSLAYSKTEFTALDGVSRPSNFDQRWRITLSGGYAFDENWEFNTSFHFATGRPYTPFGGTTWVRSRADYNTYRTAVNHNLDLRISRRWWTGSLVINTFLDVQNVYNRKSSEPPYWNQADNRPENPATLGIVPSIGISVEF